MSDASSSVMDDIRHADLIQVIGEAFTITFRFWRRDATGNRVKADLGLVAARATEIRRTLTKAVQRALGTSYDVDDVALEGNVAIVAVTATELRRRPIPSFSSRTGAEWIAAVAGAVEQARRDLRSLASSDDLIVKAKWTPGAGVQILLGAVDQNSPDSGLYEQLRSLKSRARSLRVFVVMAAAFGAVFLLIGAVVYAFGSDTFTLVIGTTYAAPFLIATAILAMMLHDVRREIVEVTAKLDLNELLEEDERRAQKQFQLNTAELKRYYDQALRQRALIFTMGMICILGGFGVVATALVLISTNPAFSTSEKITIATLGGVGGLLGDFIAVIFLRMFSETIQSVIKFHDSLVVTHHVHFGNVLVTRIADEPMRHQTLASMALLLAENEKSADPLAGAANGGHRSAAPAETNGAHARSGAG